MVTSGAPYVAYSPGDRQRYVVKHHHALDAWLRTNRSGDRWLWVALVVQARNDGDLEKISSVLSKIRRSNFTYGILLTFVVDQLKFISKITWSLYFKYNVKKYEFYLYLLNIDIDIAVFVNIVSISYLKFEKNDIEAALCVHSCALEFALLFYFWDEQRLLCGPPP